MKVTTRICALLLGLMLVAVAGAAQSAQATVSIGWHMQTPAPPETISDLDGSSSSDVWAAGYPGVVSHWDGQSWQSGPIADTGGFTAVRGISEISSADVWVVGSREDSQTVAEHWNGTGWSRFATPSPGTLNTLDAIDAVSATDIWSVGSDYDNTAGVTTALIEHWNGTSWSTSATPDTGTSALNAVSALSASNVWAVGGSDGAPLIERWNGASWSVVAQPATAGQLFAVHATGSGNVWAVGWDSDSGQALVEHWNGSSWSISATPDLGATDSRLFDVTATGPSDVWAVGQMTPPGVNQQTLIEHWNGSSWKVASSPNVTGYDNTVSDVLVFSASDGWAGGNANGPLLLRLGSADFTSQLALTGSSPVPIDTQTILNGQLSFSEGASSAGATVHLTGTDPLGSETPLPDATVAADGTFQIDAIPTLRGTYTYTATFDGNAGRGGSTDTFQQDVTGHPGRVTVAVSKRLVPYGSRVTVTAHLVAGEPHGTVSIWKTPAGGTKRLLISGPVDDNGDLATTLALKRNTGFTATFAGDDLTEPDTSPKVSVGVRALVTGSMQGGYATSSGYRLYHFTSSCPRSGRGCPRYATTVRPNHAGDCVRFTLQVRVRGAWRTALHTRCTRLNRRSKKTLTLIYGNQNIIGIPIRVRAEFNGDATNQAAVARWSKFKVTR